MIPFTVAELDTAPKRLLAGLICVESAHTTAPSRMGRGCSDLYGQPASCAVVLTPVGGLLAHRIAPGTPRDAAIPDHAHQFVRKLAMYYAVGRGPFVFPNYG